MNLTSELQTIETKSLKAGRYRSTLLYCNLWETGDGGQLSIGIHGTFDCSSGTLGSIYSIAGPMPLNNLTIQDDPNGANSNALGQIHAEFTLLEDQDVLLEGSTVNANGEDVVTFTHNWRVEKIEEV